jgi:hypothetical protein
MKISHWSILGYAGGIAFSLLSAIRYGVIYPDEDRAIVYVIIGCIICALAWIYNVQLNQSNKILAIEEYLQDKK